MTIVPSGDAIVCEMIVQQKTTSDTGNFLYEDENVPVYKIESISKDIKDCIFSVGDEVICNSTGTRVHENDFTRYLFKYENIVAKIMR